MKVESFRHLARCRLFDPSRVPSVASKSPHYSNRLEEHPTALYLWLLSKFFDVNTKNISLSALSASLNLCTSKTHKCAAELPTCIPQLFKCFHLCASSCNTLSAVADRQTFSDVERSLIALSCGACSCSEWPTYGSNIFTQFLLEWAAATSSIGMSSMLKLNTWGLTMNSSTYYLGLN